MPCNELKWVPRYIMISVYLSLVCLSLSSLLLRCVCCLPTILAPLRHTRSMSVASVLIRFFDSICSFHQVLARDSYLFVYRPFRVACLYWSCPSGVSAVWLQCVPLAPVSVVRVVLFSCSGCFGACLCWLCSLPCRSSWYI